jgi:hypothetical protein
MLTSFEPLFPSVSESFLALAEGNRQPPCGLSGQWVSNVLPVMTVGSTPTTFPPSACSVVLSIDLSPIPLFALYRPGAGYHSCQVGTPSNPRFKRVQLLSSCLAAWLKYRPSVESAAWVVDTTAVPAEPVKPDMKAVQRREGIGELWPAQTAHKDQQSHLGVRRMERYIRIGDYLPREQLFRREKYQ